MISTRHTLVISHHSFHVWFRPRCYAERKLYDEEKNLVGIIDAIYEKDGNYILVDYKTGKYRESDYKDYLDELHLYVYLVQKTTTSRLIR